VITRELADAVSLEDYCADWARRRPAPAIKWTLIRRVAEMTAAMHRAGLNHRDLYICHFLLQRPWPGPEAPLHLHLIDLHRVQQRNVVPRRWRVKDLAALYYSALDIGLTRRDLFRFVRWYDGLSPARTLRQRAGLWRAVEQRAMRLQQRHPAPPLETPDG
jgi:heptose I phosphotransferase